MFKKYLIGLCLFFGFILIYLIIAYFWALNASEIALEQYKIRHKFSSELSEKQTSVLLKIEDPSFWDNVGIDVSHDGQGKTTITQSIVPILLYRCELLGWKSLFQTLYSSLWPKFKKIDLGRDVMALAVSKKIHKDEILKIYIEQSYFGYFEDHAVIGFSDASNKYFGKELQSLDQEEFAGLVGMLKSPDYFNPIKNKDAFLDRQSRIIKLIDGKCFPKGLFDTTYPACS